MITELPQDWENRDTGRAQQNRVSTRTPEKLTVTPTRDPDLPVCAWEALVEVWVNSGLPWGQLH